MSSTSDAGADGGRRTPRSQERPTDAAPAPADHTGDDQNGRGDRFVIHEHHARRLHWDVRLERDGVLVSWAVPRGLPTDPRKNHLAVRTEDHPLAYADFAGTIPKGEYGAGEVSIWDRGQYRLESWSAQKVKVTLHGDRVHGRYAFFSTGRTGETGTEQASGRPDQDNRTWMVHRMDPPGGAPSGSTDLQGDPGREPMPGRMAPMLAVAATAPPGGDDWAYEVKWDGVRTLAFVDGGRARLRSRSGLDVTDVFPELRALGPAFGATQVILDGEIVAFGPAGTPDFELLSHRVHIATPAMARRAAATIPVRYLVFDLLFLDGHSLVAQPYSRRRALLAEQAERGRLRLSEELVGTGDEVMAASSAAGLEGVVAKRRSSPYQAGRRSADWVKVRHVRRQSVLVGGWEPGTGRRTDRIGALLVGVATPAGPRYAGQVGTGFSEATLDRLAALLAPLRRPDPPLRDVPAAVASGAVWVDPELIAEVEFTSWTADGRLRHPSFQGLRLDISPADTARSADT
ncbi:non-homologous end-joining DNA ligase [Frankia sp. AiPs1]|uniref:non-homologous end-joining DNA ligase n=1 Tax=Frankia sp. AiPs1 TaxID=573493 RepID=UPI0020433E4E|nr:non-homologous end-joining DNA ligase [Frankia sp. AiPs1]MCM3922291.1 non-homologous end-joining DNA ligase [Frankia sp. AiPs1]